MNSILKKYPYISPFIAGAIFYILSIRLDGNIASLLLNISASLFTIPVVIIVYEKIIEKEKIRANKDVSEYVKMNFDRELLHILGRISWIVFNKKSTPEIIEQILSLDSKSLQESLGKTQILVFWLATDWNYNEEQLSKLLSNELFYENLSTEERNLFIRIIKALRSLEHTIDPRYFMADGASPEHYRILKGSDIEPNTQFVSRYLLVKDIERNDQFIVMGFNDIKSGKFKLDLLVPVRINAEGQRILATVLAELTNYINTWLTARGREFIIDDKNFRKNRKNKY